MALQALASAAILARSGGGRGELYAAPTVGDGLNGLYFVDAAVRQKPRRIPSSLLSAMRSAVTRILTMRSILNNQLVDDENTRQHRGEAVLLFSYPC